MAEDKYAYLRTLTQMDLLDPIAICQIELLLAERDALVEFNRMAHEEIRELKSPESTG